MSQIIPNQKMLIKESLIILQVAGLNPTKINFYENFKCCASFMCFFIITIELILVCLLNTGDFKKFLYDMVTILGCQQVLIKIYLIFSNRAELTHLIQLINSNYWKTDIYGGKTQKQIENRNNFVKKVFIFAIIHYVLACITYFINPLINRTLPIAFYYPSVSNMSLLTYMIALIYQFYVIIIFGLPAFLGIDMLITSIIIYNLNELKLIKKGFTLLGNEDALGDDLKEFKVLVEHHNLVLDSLIRVQNIMSVFFLNMFASTAIVICLCMIGTINEGLNLENIFHFILELFLYSNVLLLYCFIGTLITSESTDVYLSIYQSNWWNSQHLNLRKDLILPMLRSQKEIKLTACKMVDINLNTFTQVIKTSYNFFNLIRVVMSTKEKR